MEAVAICKYCTEVAGCYKGGNILHCDECLFKREDGKFPCNYFKGKDIKFYISTCPKCFDILINTHMGN